MPMRCPFIPIWLAQVKKSCHKNDGKELEDVYHGSTTEANHLVLRGQVEGTHPLTASGSIPATVEATSKRGAGETSDGTLCGNTVCRNKPPRREMEVYQQEKGQITGIFLQCPLHITSRKFINHRPEQPSEWISETMLKRGGQSGKNAECDPMHVQLENKEGTRQLKFIYG